MSSVVVHAVPTTRIHCCAAGSPDGEFSCWCVVPLRIPGSSSSVGRDPSVTCGGMGVLAVNALKAHPSLNTPSNYVVINFAPLPSMMSGDYIDHVLEHFPPDEIMCMVKPDVSCGNGFVLGFLECASMKICFNAAAATSESPVCMTTDVDADGWFATFNTWWPWDEGTRPENPPVNLPCIDCGEAVASSGPLV